MNQGSHVQPSAHELLRTKLTPPRLRKVHVSRAALLARLDEGLHHKLTLLSAPAGSGKTTLVSEWIASRGAREDLPPVAWVSLDEGDNDPVRFWRYVLTACQTFDATVGEATLEMLRTAQHSPVETMLTAFINDLAQLSRSSVLVLEDYHVINTQQVHETIAFLLDYLPVTLHLVLISRSDPSLPLARLRARNEICELRAADLRFSQAETEIFLQQNIHFSLPSAAIALLEERTEGWVAGLQLVALALQRHQQLHAVEDFLDTFSGSQRHILDYLAEEVLSAQPEHIQRFLLQTTFLSRLTRSLCNAVTDREDSTLLLEEMERGNLFLTSLDGSGHWYRYHELFAEAMHHVARRRLGEGELRALHNKASLWYEQHGYLADAVETALAAQAHARAANLIEGMTGSERFKGEHHTLRRWLEQLPEELLHERPKLCLSYAMALLFTLDRSAPATMARVEKPLQMAEQHWRAQEDETQLGQLFAFRSMVAFWQGNFARSFATARKALHLLPEHDFYWRGNSLFTAALETMFAGRMKEARQMLLEARALSEAAGNDYGTRAATFILSEVCIEQGELQQAAQLFQQVLQEAGEDRLDQSHALIGLATLAYEWNDLESAERYVSQALQISRQHAADLGEQLTAEALTVPGSLLLARVEHALGERAQVQRRLQALNIETKLSPLLRMDLRACQTRLALAAGDIASVERWHRTLQESDDRFHIQQEREARLHARVLIARGEAEDALRLLKPWLADAHVHGRTGSELEIHALMALAHFAQDNLPQARQALIRSLTLAQPGEYQRLFLDEGEAMAALLRVVYADVRDLPLAMYVRTLLLAFAEEPSGQISSPSTDSLAFVEPLSPQEERVLRLLAAGLSNPEIAQELVVSVNTVKTQVQSIYRKLDVRSRQEASVVARQLDLA